ncbi:MAG TPA: hydroxymethylbilane synthase [Eubacteriaceae bacterium]|nr:hydroxymethylbilane synthase [Eubacteriaceae bacterium]
MHIRVGTRGSRLAMAQSKQVLEDIVAKNPQVTYELVVIKTTGDRIQDVALDKIGDKGIFVKEIEEQLLSKEIDLAVHSMKDMPGEIDDRLIFSATPKRADHRDVMIFKDENATFEKLKKNAVIATGSKRRGMQLQRSRKDLRIESIRGNVETRIRKLFEQNLDALVVAACGLDRLGIAEKYEHRMVRLEPSVMLPAPAQGILALQIHKDNEKLDLLLQSIRDRETTIQKKAERAFLKGVNGSCHVPIGAYATVDFDRLALDGLYGTEDGQCVVRKELTGSVEEAETIGFELARQIVKEMK